MADIYKKAIELQFEFPVSLETIVNLILKNGYNKTIIILLGGTK